MQMQKSVHKSFIERCFHSPAHVQSMGLARLMPLFYYKTFTFRHSKTEYIYRINHRKQSFFLRESTSKRKYLSSIVMKLNNDDSYGKYPCECITLVCVQNKSFCPTDLSNKLNVNN